MESRLDHVYRTLLLTKFFTRGWGKPEHLTQVINHRKILGKRETNSPYLQTPASVITITKEELKDDLAYLTGQFPSPTSQYLDEDIIPPEVRTSHFEVVLPRSVLIIIENPYYGLHKPRKQLRSSLFFVSDLFIMGAVLILEAWEQSFSPLVCHGISMRGHMASLATAASHIPVGLTPCLAATSGSVTFCRGVMSGAINWSQLELE